MTVTLTPGMSVSLVTGQVVAPVNLPIEPFTIMGLARNDLRALSSALLQLSCAWTTDACHRYVDQCPAHPRTTVDTGTWFHCPPCSEGITANDLQSLSGHLRWHS